MKSILLFLSLIATHTAAAQVSSMTLVSPMNFGLPALLVETPAEGKVSIRIDPALLLMSEKTPVFEPSQDLQVELATIFNMPKLNAIIIEFEASDCVTDSVHKDVFYCQATGPRSVKGAESDFASNLVAVSGTEIQTGTVYVSVSKYIVFEPGFQDTRYEATVRLVPEQQGPYISLQKRQLSMEQQF